MKVCQKTESKIYSCTYWGGRTFEEKRDAEIIKNRNSFIVDFDIKNIKKKSIRYIDRYIKYLEKTLGTKEPSAMLDHIEVYERNDGKIIFLNSPYCDNEKELEGFEKIYKLYDLGANSFIQIVDKKEIHEKTKKSAKESLKDFYENLNPEKKYKTCPVCFQKYGYSLWSHHLKSKKHQMLLNFKKQCKEIEEQKETYDFSNSL